jgi:MFS family permease
MLFVLIFGGEGLASVSRFHNYTQGVRMLSRNAKLYLLATGLQGLGSGIWGVIFYLYLKLPEVGFEPNFIGNVFTAGAMATGLIALPAGLLCERIGPRRGLLIGLAANLINIVQILVLQSSALLAASLSAGLIGTVGWVAGAPFMAENSTSEERTYLFSVNWALMIIMGVVGSLLGGVMPDLFNNYMGLQTGRNGSASGYRTALTISVALSLAAAVPILIMKERERIQKHRMVDLLNLRNVRSARMIVKFMIPTAIIGFGAGFIVPLFNVFFSDKFNATAQQVGLMSAMSNVTLGVGTLVAPVLSKRLGKAKSVVLCEYLSMPFIMLTTLAPNLTMAASAYVARTALMNMAGPIGTALQMELVTENERATTNGLMVMADNIPRSVTASVSGEMMTVREFVVPFMFTTVTYFIASSIYFYFFRNAEAEVAKARSEKAI